jgi:hypothetical protein
MDVFLENKLTTAGVIRSPSSGERSGEDGQGLPAIIIIIIIIIKPWM